MNINEARLEIEYRIIGQNGVKTVGVTVPSVIFDTEEEKRLIKDAREQARRILAGKTG